MSIDYRKNAQELRIKYEAENIFLDAKWRGDLDRAADGDGSKEGDMPADWRDGWIDYLDLVVSIGSEKIAQLKTIEAAPDNKSAKKLVEKLQAAYEVEKAHYQCLANQSRAQGDPSIVNLAGLLDQEATDRQQYSGELIV